MLSASGPGGVTGYAYTAPTGSVNDNALTSVTNPDGTQQLFTYNAEGWLASQSGAGDAGLLTYSYPGPGEMTVTDALGDSTTYRYGLNGEVAQTQDALGDVTQYTYNAVGELTGEVTPGGESISVSYDASGDPVSYTTRSAALSLSPMPPARRN